MTQSTERSCDSQSHVSSTKLYCYRCGNVWSSPDGDISKTCPRCKSSKWDSPVKKEATCAFCGNMWLASKIDDKCPHCGHLRTDSVIPDILHCNQCDHDWAKRSDNLPKKCPVCKSSRWNESKAHQFTCFRCGHVWRNKKEKPDKCPKCQSSRWDVPAYKLQCRRCGYKWSTRGGKSSDEVKICPSCKSRKWNEVPRISVCASCGSYYISKSGTSESRCPVCSSKKRSFSSRCQFCGMIWTSTSNNWSICPRCGKPRSDGKDEFTIEIWAEGDFSLKYVYSDDFGFIYLWKDGQPVATMYLHDLLREMNMTASQLIPCFSDPMYSPRWRVISKGMYEHRDDYLKDVSYFIKRLNICEFDATLLAIHFKGMGPEAIAVKFNLSLEDVRKSFDRIMAAYADSGIVVNDSIFTNDPKSKY